MLHAFEHCAWNYAKGIIIIIFNSRPIIYMSNLFREKNNLELENISLTTIRPSNFKDRDSLFNNKLCHNGNILKLIG